MTANETVDVLIIGAGLSGIGAAYHLQDLCPNKTFTILEGREDIGGTWDLFRYPGIRSDSDMHTLGFEFKPWTNAKSIADAPSIMEYLRETVEEFDIGRHIRFQHLATEAAWSTTDQAWTVTATNGANNETVTVKANFLYMCSGYYSYKGGYTPEFPGADKFQGQVVHPQKWPEDMDYTDKNVVVIGSGATAVTLVPAMAKDTASITMLQRSPTYMVSRPGRDAVANKLRKVLPEKLAYKVTRFKNVQMGQFFYNKTRTNPEETKEKLLGALRKELGEDYDIDTHFTPTYNPWDQRLCLVPNSDFFEAVKSGDATVVTDHIESFTETGIQLTSGQHLDADIIVTATGLQLVTVGDMDFFVDGNQVDFSKSWTYKGIAYSDVPNMASVFGYINASWTLRADLISKWVCRLLNHMTEAGVTQATPRLRASDQSMPERPWIDDFPAGYMQRSMAMMPRQGDREPWVNTQSFSADKELIGKAPIDDGVMQFTKAPVSLGAAAN